MKRPCYLIGHKYRLLKVGETLPNGYKLDSDHAVCSCGSYHSIYGRYSFEEISKEYRWKSSFWHSDTFKSMCLILGFALGIYLAIFLAYIWPESSMCQQYAKMGHETVFNFWTGCMVYSEKFGWVPNDEFFKLLNVNLLP